MNKRINVGILAHADAGKTTLTEQILFLTGSIRSAGSVDDGTASTDSMTVEKQRGISVKTALTSVSWKDACINIIDTPGHSDFISEVERALAALDFAVLVISAAEGVEAQTEILLDTLIRLNRPFVVFLNKTDRAGSDCKQVLKDLHELCGNRRKLFPYSHILNEGENTVQSLPVDFTQPQNAENAVMAVNNEELLESLLSDDIGFQDKLYNSMKEAFWNNLIIPVFCGSTKFSAGITPLLDFLSDNAIPPQSTDNPLSAVILKITHDTRAGKLLYVRVFSGTLCVRQALETKNGVEKIARIQRPEGKKLVDTDTLLPGETGVLHGISAFIAGDFIGNILDSHASAALPEPTLTVQISPEKPDELPNLQKALAQLSEEDPHLNFRYIPEKKELHLSIYGEIQTEVLASILLERYSLCVSFSKPSVIYKETPSKTGEGFDAYTMPKPCWAILRFLIEPLPPGSGLIYESKTPNSRLLYRYQEHVQASVPKALLQGINGWEVTDLKVTLIDGEHHHVHTHPMDFFLATPLAIMDGLRRTGTTVLEPINLVTFRCPEIYAGKTLGIIATHRGTIISQNERAGSFSITAEIPASECLHFTSSYPSVTAGTGSLSLRFSKYTPCPDTLWEKRERVGVNPLDRSKYILWMRGAINAE